MGADERKLELAEALEEKARRKRLKDAEERVVGFLASNPSRLEANAFYDSLDGDKGAARILCQKDLFFLLTRALGRRDADRDWLYDRCREVQADPYGHLDLWARDHYKSTIITFAHSIQEILNDPEITIGIFSHTRDIALAFVDQIKRELERNEFLKDLFPDILWDKPPKTGWSLEGGIIVRRQTNPKEATVEGWGLVDGQPTGKHFRRQQYDDVVTLKSVTNPDQIKKTTSCLEMSFNLGSQTDTLRGMVGTRYHLNDTYRAMLDRGTFKARTHPATRDGKYPGEPVLLDLETLQTKRRDMGPYTFGTQMLQNPIADNAMGFKSDWLVHYERLGDTTRWNTYILVDPAGQKKEQSDYTVILVIGLAPDQNYYLLDGVRDRMNLTERTRKLFEFHRKWTPRATAYERYGLQSDVEHVRYVQEQDNYRFPITELGGSIAKEDRILKLVPIFEQKRMWLPKQLYFVDYQQMRVDLVQTFLTNEYLAFPVAVHDDMLDCMARILDPQLGAVFPKEQAKQRRSHDGGGGGSWMG